MIIEIIILALTLVLLLHLFQKHDDDKMLFYKSASQECTDTDPSPYCLPVRQTTPQVLDGGLTIFTGADAWFN